MSARDVRKLAYQMWKNGKRACITHFGEEILLILDLSLTADICEMGHAAPSCFQTCARFAHYSCYTSYDVKTE